MTTYDPDALIRHYRERAARGLAAEARDVQADMQATRQHGDITSATRQSYRAYAVGPGLDESAVVAEAVTAVAQLNPGAEALHDYTLPADTLGVIMTGFTDYLPELQTEQAGKKGVLRPTLQFWASELARAAAEGA